MESKKDPDSADQFVDFLALSSFKIDTVIELLIQKDIITKDELKKGMFKKIEQGDDEKSIRSLKERINKVYE